MNENGWIFPETCSQSNETFMRIDILYRHHIINWPNFTNCLPNCGLCQTFASDATYNIVNLFLIGSILPLIGFCGLVGNSLSAFIYSRSGKLICHFFLLKEIFEI